MPEPDQGEELWEGPPVEASSVIRALVTIGEVPLEAKLLDSSKSP